MLSRRLARRAPPLHRAGPLARDPSWRRPRPPPRRQSWLAPLLTAAATTMLLALVVLPVLPRIVPSDPTQRYVRAVVSEHSRTLMWGARHGEILPSALPWLTQESGISLPKVFVGDDRLDLRHRRAGLSRALAGRRHPLPRRRRPHPHLHRAARSRAVGAGPGPRADRPLAAGPRARQRLRGLGLEARRGRLLPRLRHGLGGRRRAVQGILLARPRHDGASSRVLSHTALSRRQRRGLGQQGPLRFRERHPDARSRGRSRSRARPYTIEANGTSGNPAAPRPRRSTTDARHDCTAGTDPVLRRPRSISSLGGGR